MKARSVPRMAGVSTSIETSARLKARSFIRPSYGAGSKYIYFTATLYQHLQRLQQLGRFQSLWVSREEQDPRQPRLV